MSTCYWPALFEKRRLFDRKTENQPYIEYLDRRFIGEEDGDEDEEEDEEAEDTDEEGEGDEDSVLSEGNEASDASELEVEGNQDEKPNDKRDSGTNNQDSNVRRFMKGTTGDEDALDDYDVVDEVANFCEARSGKALHRKHVALLDERNSGGTIVDKRGHCRTNLKPLTSEQLCKELSKKRFRLQSDSTNAFEEIDAERRILFIPDLDPSSIEAIVTTAPLTQAPALRGLFYKYLTRKTSIGVTIPSKGFSVFTLEFHMSYYALERSKVSISDTRLKSDGSPLRKSQKLDYLSRSRDEASKYSDLTTGHYWLHEAQTSIVVTGIDQYVWTAYGFIDTYFGSSETVDGYDELKGQALGRADPIAAGQINGDEPIWTPREYFLTVVRIRMQKILKEWNRIVRTIEQEIEWSKNDPLVYNAPKNTAQELKFLIGRNGDIASLLTTLIGSLSKSINAWEEFHRTEINYFLDGGETTITSSSPLKLSLIAINKDLSQLRLNLRELEGMKKVLCERRDGLNAHLGLEGRATARQLQDLTVVQIIYYPLGIAATLFSATGVLPFTPSLVKLIYVVLALVFSMVVILIVLFNWRYWLQQGVDCAQNAINYYNRRLRGNEALPDLEKGLEDGPGKVKVG